MSAPSISFAFLGMNAAATLQGPLPAWTKQLGAQSVPKQTYAAATATDSSGNVYATGFTAGGFDGNSQTGTTDAFLAKYNSSGIKIWSLQKGVASKNLTSTSVAVDSSGNVVIAGYTNTGVDGNSLTGTQDFFVVKYDSTGTRLWTKQLGVASQPTYGNGVAVDSSGNVFVAGTTSGGLDGNTLTGSGDHFVTKYNSAGTKQWTKQLGVSGSSTYGSALAIDSSGNVFVAGHTVGNLDGNTGTGSFDFYVTKYNTTGAKLWTKQLGAGGGAQTYGYAATADAAGNVFVTGYTGGSLDGQTNSGFNSAYITKYDSSGTKQWTRLLDVSSGMTYGYGLATDSSGNILLTGSTDTAIDSNTQTGATDVFVAKYNPTGTRLWSKQLGASSANVQGSGAATDSSGNIFVIGSTSRGLDGNTFIGPQDLFLIKYSSSGSKYWTMQKGSYTGSGGTVDTGAAATDSSGNVFVAGNTDVGLDGNTLTGTTDFYVTKYSASGARLWTKQLGTSSQDTKAYGVATDSSGNVFVTGLTTGPLDGNSLIGDVDYFITKYNSSGVKQWTKQLGKSSGFAQTYAIATDSAGNFYVAGRTDSGLDGNTVTGNFDLFVVKFNSSGTRQWTRQMGVSGRSASAYGVATDSSGNVFVVGQSSGALDGISNQGPYDGFVVKYNASGTKLWTKILDQSLTDVTSEGVATDSSGNVIITGWTDSAYAGNTLTGTRDVLISKYDSSGTVLWNKQLGVASEDTIGQAVATDSFGNIFVSGYTTGGLDGNTLKGSEDFFVTKYSSSGLLQWTKQMGVSAQSTEGYGIAIDSSGRLYIGGTTTGGLDGNTLKGSTDLFISQFIGN